MKKGAVMPISVIVLDAIGANFRTCLKDEYCYESACLMVCAAWCDELNCEPQELCEAITLLEQMKK